MSSTSTSEDEFEQFRARAYSGGNILSLQQLREEQKQQSRGHQRRSLCPADEDSSDSDDGYKRAGRCTEKHESSKQQHSRNGTLRVPRTYRSRSLSPSHASTMDARSRARLKVEQLRQLLSKQSQDSQDEPTAVNRNMSPKHQKVMKKRSVDICFPQSYTDQQEEKKEVNGNRHTFRRRSDVDHLLCPSLKLTYAFNSGHTDERPWELGEMRPRVSSMPSGTVTKRHSWRKVPSIHTFATDNKNIHKIREFQLTPKGNVINKGSYLSHSNTSVESAASTTASATSLVEGPYHVFLMGIPGVGIKALISTFIADQIDDLDSSDEDGEKSVSVLLDGEEATMHFIDVSDEEVAQYISSQKADAYVIVYSVEDRESYEGAVDRLYTIRNDDPRSVAVILVANKMDLVRNRIVQDDEGRSAAKNYDCKFIEVSAAIDHKVDDLLVGILKQIRLIKERNESAAKGKHKHRPKLRPRPDETCCLLRAKQNVLGRLLRSGKYASKSCDNLYVL